MTDIKLSVILATPAGYGAVRHTIDSLSKQGDASALELVLVTPLSHAEFQLDEIAVSAFGRVQLVHIGAFQTVGSANAVGVRHASAAVVALTEDHVFFAPGWAEALLVAHEKPYAAVSPLVANANPATLLSWSDFLMGYGPWAEPEKSGTKAFLPGHNTSYKRAILLRYDDNLASMLETETLLHWDLRAKGHELYLTTDARIYHMNFSRFRTWALVTFMNGRIFAATRVLDWALPKKLLYATTWFVIPWVRLRRIWAPTRAAPVFPRILPTLLFQLYISAWGEMMGYVLGVRDQTKANSASLEVLRVEHIDPRDLQRLAKPEA